MCRISNKRPCLTAESPASAAVGRGAECENCEKVTAVVACQQCECNFCSACAEQIHAFKAMKKHGLAAIGEGATPNTASVASNTPQSAQVAQPQPQPQPPPAVDGFGFAVQSVRCARSTPQARPLYKTVCRVQHHRSQPQDGSAEHMAALRADRERERGLAERRDKEASEAYAEQMRVSCERIVMNCYQIALLWPLKCGALCRLLQKFGRSNAKLKLMHRRVCCVACVAASTVVVIQSVASVGTQCLLQFWTARCVAY